MAKKASVTNGQTSGENVSGYFRTVFAENPQLLDSRSNDELVARWVQDHPGSTVTPERVRQNLSNIKSVLRQKARKKPGRPKKDSQPAPAATSIAAPSSAPRKSVRGLDTLEEHIDECLSLAKHLDREGLSQIISLLRRARNEVVWSMGKTVQA